MYIYMGKRKPKPKLIQPELYESKFGLFLLKMKQVAPSLFLIIAHLLIASHTLG